MSTTPEQLGYSRGYAAASRRVKDLEIQIEALKSIPAKAAGKQETIEYLLQTADALTRAARVLIDAEAKP